MPTNALTTHHSPLRILVAAAVLLTLCGFRFPGPAPTFTGDDSNLHLQGIYDRQTIYIGPWQTVTSRDGGWGQYCNQRITAGPGGAGRTLGFYVDDSVSGADIEPFTDAATNERVCVALDRAAFPHALIIAATNGRANTSNLSGATITAREWYPYCGSAGAKRHAPMATGYILQYNFVRSVRKDGESGNCRPTPRAAVARLWARIARTHPRLLLYY